MKFAFLFALLFAALLPARAEERIPNFASDITINPDASLTVTETITVNAEAKSIRHGISREFPTIYRNDYGKLKIGFEVLSVLRDGQKERYVVESSRNGVEVRIGSAKDELTPGLHTYVLTYRTTFQLGFFTEGDQLFFNVTGNGWIYPIDEASAVIHLPNGARSTRLAAYTGSQGSTARNAVISELTPGTVTARTIRPLGRYQGLTIVVEWPKGFVEQPGAVAYAWRWLTSNLTALFGLAGLVLAAVILFGSWLGWGRDPPRGTVIPLLSPPDNVEPAEARFLAEMGYDNQALAAAVVNMAVKGAIRIDDKASDDSGTYRLIKLESGADALAPLERAAYGELFKGSDTIELKQKNGLRIHAASTAVAGGLRLRHLGKSFHDNRTPLALAAIVLGFAALPALILAEKTLASYAGIGALLIGGALYYIFDHLMRAPTRTGQALRDRIDGFRMFLDTAEKERWEILNPPEMTPQLFEKYLPFALALNVQHSWSQTFEREMNLRDPEGYRAYEPSWHSGNLDFHGLNAAAFSASFSSAISNAISSASSAPGSRSGFGGGGFSGGGGGGGGGRGW